MTQLVIFQSWPYVEFASLYRCIAIKGPLDPAKAPKSPGLLVHAVEHALAETEP